MITLLGSLLGFLGAALPEMLGMMAKAQDSRHALALAELGIVRKAEAEERKALYATYRTDVAWVDALNGTVRPVLAYAFFLLYAYVKITQLIHTPWLVWNEEDQLIFASIISYYFGQRGLAKFRYRN